MPGAKIYSDRTLSVNGRTIRQLKNEAAVLVGDHLTESQSLDKIANDKGFHNWVELTNEAKPVGRPLNICGLVESSSLLDIEKIAVRIGEEALRAIEVTIFDHYQSAYKSPLLRSTRSRHPNYRQTVVSFLLPFWTMSAAAIGFATALGNERFGTERMEDTATEEIDGYLLSQEQVYFQHRCEQLKQADRYIGEHHELGDQVLDTWITHFRAMEPNQVRDFEKLAEYVEERSISLPKILDENNVFADPLEIVAIAEAILERAWGLSTTQGIYSSQKLATLIELYQENLPGYFRRG